jgi:AcrR family transcriptional regulator
MPHDPAATRRRILEAADALFYAEGVRAIGVDRIAEQAGVTKRTLYYHFRSKDDLVAAYLAERDAPTMARYRRWFGGEGATVAERVAGMFGAFAEAASAPEWRGCGFLRVAVELADLPGHPARVIAAAHKKRFEAWLAEEIRAERLPEPEATARCLMVVLDGTVAQMIIHRDRAYVEAAKTLARSVLCPRQTRRSSKAPVSSTSARQPGGTSVVASS